MASDKWTDIFEPQTLDEMIGQKELVNAFKIYVRDRHIPSMTISGSPGIGKTLLMKCFATDLGFIKYIDGKKVDLQPGQFFLMDASSDRGIDYVRGTIKRLAQKPTIDGTPRLIVLDEFNYTGDAQAALRHSMQECTDNTSFIILSNDTSNMIDAIVSRCPIKVAQPLMLEDMKVIIARIQKVKEFKISPEAVELLFKLTQGDIRAFIGQLQDAAIISNYNIEVNHIQSVSVDLQTAKSILEVAQNNYDQAREVLITIFSKTRNAKDLLDKLYMATYITKFSEDIESNKIISMRIRDRMSDIDDRLTRATNHLLQLDSLINYIRLIKFIPLQCPKTK